MSKPPIKTPADQPAPQDDSANEPRTRKLWDWMAITAFLTALALVAGNVFSGLNFNALKQQVEIARSQAETAAQSQYIERFTKAVEQLDATGPEHLQSRLGGVYALARLAIDKPEHQPMVVEVLCAFIRTTSPIIENAPLVPADVQAALTALGRRNRAGDNGAVVDLTSANLRGADLSKLNLAEAKLPRAYLAEAKMREVDLSYADLSDANLAATVMTGARLERADLTGAYLYKANLTNANLTNAATNSAVFRDAVTDGARGVPK